MQAGQVGGSSGGFGAKKIKVNPDPVAEQAVQPEAQAQPEVPSEPVDLAALFTTTKDALRTSDQGNGQQRSEMTIALVPQDKQAELEKLGAVFPEIKQVRSNEGLDADGRLEVVSVHGTGNPETTNVLQPMEVAKSDLVRNEEGVAPIDSKTAHLLDEGEFVVPKGTQVAPAGYEFKLATSTKGAETEKKRLRLNNMSDALGNFSQSSLAGVIRLPYVSSVAPIVALATAGPTLNRAFEQIKESEDHLEYVHKREKLSKTDMITLEAGVNVAIPVSAEQEIKRTELKLRTAKSKLASTALLGMAGGASVLSFAAAGGAFGTGAVAAALTGAAAATPFLAGAGMIISSGGMVMNSLSELKSLAKEKAELQALLDKGQTHVLKTIEKVIPQAGRPVAVGEQQVPIQERLKVITKEQRKHRLLATALGGGIGSIAMTVGAGASALSVAPLFIAPAGVLAAGQSIAKLKELSAEKKELVKLHEAGETLTPRQIERQDGSWSEEKIPISTLLQDIEKKQKTQKAILTAVGGAGMMFGLTLGAGLSFAAAAPFLLIPAAIGAALFPDKVKAFAEKVAGYISGKFGAAGKSRKELVESAQEKTAALKQTFKEDLKELADSNPTLFYVPSKKEIKAAAKANEAPPVGYFIYLESLMDKYAEAGSRVARFQAMQEIEALLAEAPPEAQKSIPLVRGKLKELHMDTEAGWVARDVMLEMKKETTDKVVEDDRVRARLGDLGFQDDDIRAQYEQSLFIENDPKMLETLLEKSRSGDREATLELARKEVFGAARLFFQSQDELGTELHAKLLDALARPTDDENLETVVKEVNYKLGRPMTPSTIEQSSEKWWLGASTQGSEAGLSEPLRVVDFAPLQNAVNTLDKPIDLNASTSPAATTLEGPQARMASAFRELHNIDSEAASQLGKAFAALNDPAAFEGLSPEQAQEKRMQAALDLTRSKAKLEEKAPQLVALWDKARLDVEEEFFQRSIDTDFVGQVLSRPEVTSATERLGLKAEDAKALYIGLLRSHVTGDGRALQGQMLDANGKEIDPKKAELLQVLDLATTSQTAANTQGGNDTVVPEAPLGKPESDPAVAGFLEQNPVIADLLASEQIPALAQQLQTSPEEVRQAYLTLLQARLNPVLTAEFDGLLSAGDLKTVRTFEIGSRVGQLVQAATRPSPEVVSQKLEELMNGPVIGAVLAHPDIAKAGEQLKVDNTSLMRVLLAADLTGDASELQGLQARAQKGDAQAQAQLSMIQTLAQAVQQFGAQRQQQLQAA